MEHSRRDAGLPLPHRDLPALPESHAVQQDEHNQQWSHRSLPLRAHLHPWHQPGRQPGERFGSRLSPLPSGSESSQSFNHSVFALQFVCTVIAILLHFFYLCTFSWLFLEGLHVYRMISEVRDINYGPMRFYYLIGWGVPAFITGVNLELKTHSTKENHSTQLVC